MTPGKLDTLTREILKEMDGREIQSLHYETTVGVRGNQVIDAGKVIDTLDTKEKVSRLFDELTYQEWGTNDLATILRREGF